MKRLMAGSFVVLAAFSGSAFAVCSTPYLNGTSASSLLNGNTACSPAGCSGTGCSWQEQHRTNGELWDFKKGSGDPVDPTSKVGTWSVAATGKVTHSYNAGGGSFVYDIKNNGNGTYSFCGTPGEIVLSIKTGVAAGCP